MKLSPRKGAFHLSLGRRGEMAGWNYLQEQGYQLLEKNYRCPLGEIDVIARYRGRIVFIEIKTRSDHRFGRPEESVHADKQRRLVRLAKYYLKEKSCPDAPASFAVLAVTRRGAEDHEVRLIENAFGDDYRGDR